MRKTLIAMAMFGVSVGSVSAASYDLDPAHTYPNFTINHLGFSNMHGHFAKTAGTLELDLAKKTGSVDVTIDAASIYTGFAKRDEHLRSPDFFNVAEFPSITFKSTKVKFTGDKSAEVEGNLTILGKSKPVTLMVTSIVCGANPMNKKETCGFDASTKFKRSEFGVNYALPAVGDEVSVTLEIEALKK